MQRALLVLIALVLATPAAAQSPPAVGSPVTLETTLTGQPIRAPSGDLRVTVTQVLLPVAAGLRRTSIPIRGW